MRIAYIVSGHFGPVSGAGLTVWSLCKNIPASHRVRVYANSWEPVVPGNVEMHHLFPRGNWPAHFFFPLRILANYISVGRLCRTIAGENEILHLYNGLASSKSLLISQLMCQKAVMEGRAKESWAGFLSQQTPKHLLVRYLENRVYRGRLYRLIVPASEFEKSQILRYYPCPPEDVVPVHGGVDYAFYNPPDRESRRRRVRERYGFSGSDLVALFVGYDFTRKGLPALLRALPAIDGRVKLLAVGGTGGARGCRRIAAELKIERRVVFAGPVYREARDLFFASDLFVLPARFDPFGTAALEAMAAGLPVIVSRRVGSAELITPGREGFLLDHPENEAEIAERTNRLVREGTLPERGATGRETARRCTWEEKAKELLSLYARLP